ncbi:MAG TPA: glycosyltransferase family 4 protein [Chloroflexia bacterium]|nr:glycosyltransferase family 4 protein [Chloroflexia bacterium]
MRIAVWHNLPSGGGKRALHHQLRGLIERGHQIEIWCPSSSDSSYLPLGSLAVEHAIPFNSQPQQAGGRVRQIWVDRQNATSRMQAMESVCRRCADEINRGGFNLLFANSCFMYAAPFITRYSGLPTALYLQEPHRAYYEANPRLPWVAEPRQKGASLRWRLFAFARDATRLGILRRQAREEWINASKADVMLVNSYYSRETMRRVYAVDAEVCYLGVDTILFRPGNSPRERFIAGLGSFFPNKGIEFALDAVARLAAPRPKLVWIGNSGDQRYIQELAMRATKLGVQLDVQFRVTDSTVVDILNRAALLLYTPYLEPFGLAPLEANACATPVVAVPEGGVRETVHDGVNGLLADRDPQAAAVAMGRLLDDSELARTLGDNGRRYVEREWTWSLAVDRLEARFRRLSASPRTRCA